jgi:6-phosphogluconolactonase
MNSRLMRALGFILPVFLVTAAAFATTPTITVTSPTNDSTTTSPVNYVATATNPDCAQGISAMRIYSAPGVMAYTSAGGNLNAYINLPAGTYQTTVVAYDNCGGAAAANVTVTTTGEETPGGFVYAVNNNYYGGNTVNNVQGFTIVASNGALAPTGQGPVQANVAPWSAASDKGGYRLYVGDMVSGDVFAYFINRDNGYLSPVPGAPFAVNRSVTAVAVHPSGQWVYATRDETAGGDGIEVFQVQSDGSLVQAAGSPYLTQIGPQSLVVDPAGKYLYVGTQSQQASFIVVFEIDSTTGGLTQISGSPFPLDPPLTCPSGGVDPTDIIDDAGKFIYTSDATDNYISGFTIGAGGSLTQMSGSPYEDTGCVTSPNCPSTCFFNPTSLAIDGTGKWLYALNSGLLDFSLYAIQSNGTLKYVKDIGSGLGNFVQIRTDATGKYLYAPGGGVLASGSGEYFGIMGFAIDSTNGDLTPLPGSPYTFYEPTTYPAFSALTVTP